ncbi:phosphoadenylyl-sulfate reductase [Govanella unica]|uniref:Adenosine 5'-phosphosulfate reductase n=1 Tax=Govanella unica TaxID=2975056 RepID=A0A9X3TWN2_9PROT|nr:phosphoadenylyl-sulfate reductase [Govania unica]MDA5193094.1 phosphoadenylyl-sulfate reductase [Govania unica]
MTSAVATDKLETAEERLERLLDETAGFDAISLLDRMIHQEFPGKIALVSSFGAESAVLLALLAEVDRSVPVVFLDTHKLFGETLRYRDQLQSLLGLTNIVTVEPDPLEVEAEDSKGILWTRDVDACCALRKVRPLARAMEGYDAWITGRKRFQASTRSTVPLIEKSGTKFKINPLADWSPEVIAEFVATRNLPPHPLVADGYLSIGCMPCTRPVKPGEDARAGRWAGLEKTECGIHVGNSI